MSLLAVNNLTASYGPIAAVKSVSLNVQKGQMVGIVGRNGAGKSTIMRCICGLHRPSGGSIQFDGQRIDGMPAHQTLRQGIAYVPEGRRIFGELSVSDNLVLGGYTKSAAERDKQLDLVYGLFPVLAERARQAGGTLSGGQQQMLAIGRALMSNPRLLMLDEPSMGLAPIVVNDLFAAIRGLHKQGLTIIIVEQKAFLTLKMVDFAHVVVHGKVTASGSGRELLASEAVQASYLGRSRTGSAAAPIAASAQPSATPAAPGPAPSATGPVEQIRVRPSTDRTLPIRPTDDEPLVQDVTLDSSTLLAAPPPSGRLRWPGGWNNNH